MDEKMDVWMDEKMDVWMDGKMDGNHSLVSYVCC
jgi:hypothetical protein